jgi:hypothetical protein
MPPRWRFRPPSTWIALFLGLLAINIYFSARATQRASRIRVPYSPFFLHQVQAGHVKSIASTGAAAQGTFTQKDAYAAAGVNRNGDSRVTAANSR